MYKTGRIFLRSLWVKMTWPGESITQGFQCNLIKGGTFVKVGITFKSICKDIH